ncbi:uncharacterized protein [Pyrus communis]|uniref:uncharacterized protein isoform X2 n=1 Tax=Pyrus communis TaxID=23211 RepID=UPI0035C18503
MHLPRSWNFNAAWRKLSYVRWPELDVGNKSTRKCIFKSTDGPVDTNCICGTIVATKKGRAGRQGKEKQWILKRGFNVQKNYKTSSTWKMASQDWKGCGK